MEQVEKLTEMWDRLEDECWWEMDGSGSGLCQITGFGITSWLVGWVVGW